MFFGVEKIIYGGSVKSYIEILDFPVFPDFEMMENLDNPENLILYSENIPIDFQGETILQRISTDFLRMSVNVSAERP